METTSLDSLRAALDTHLHEGSLSPATCRTYESHWASWKDLCSGSAVPRDPLNAPFDVYTELLTQQPPLTPDQVSRRVSAIRHFHELEGKTPVFDLPPNNAEWRRLTSAYGSLYSDLVHSPEVRPLLRQEVRELTATEPEWDRRGLLRAAFTLLAWDSGWSTRGLLNLRHDQVIVDTDCVHVDGEVFRCDHGERVEGVAWGCTACAISAIHIASAPGWLFDGLRGSDARVFDKVVSQHLRRLHASPLGLHLVAPARRCQSALSPVPDLDEWSLAGLRRALLLTWGHPIGPRLLRARAWVAVPWAHGLVMASDLIPLRRNDVRWDASERLWTLQWPKGSETLRPGAIRSVPWHGGGRALTDYICVRDLIVGEFGHLLVPTESRRSAAGGLPVSQGDPIERSSAQNDLDLLLTIAGVNRAGATPASLRLGHLIQSLDDGRCLEQASRTMGHKSPEFTSRLLQTHGDQRSSAMIMKGLAHGPLS